MIVVDTNVILAALRQPVTSHDERHHHRQSAKLIGQISENSQRALMPEIVLHECFYVLVMRDRDVSVDSFCELFRRMLEWPGWAMGSEETAIFTRAVDILQDNPKLEFSDAVIAARAEAHGAELATFDRRLAEAYGGPIWMDS